MVKAEWPLSWPEWLKQQVACAELLVTCALSKATRSDNQDSDGYCEKANAIP